MTARPIRPMSHDASGIESPGSSICFTAFSRSTIIVVLWSDLWKAPAKNGSKMKATGGLEKILS